MIPPVQLIDRYVQEVARRLPARQRDEVRRELRSNLLDALEDRAGREAVESDAVALLAELAAPDEAAAAYFPANRYLIGPDWYPTFRVVLRALLAVYATLFVVSFALKLLLGDPTASVGVQLFGRLTGTLDSALLAFAVVVGIFHLLERSNEKPRARAAGWDPRELPAVPDHAVVSRFESAAGVVFPAVVLALAFQLRDSIGLRLREGGPLHFNGVVQELMPWLAAATLVGMAVHAGLLWRGHWSPLTRAGDLLADLLGLALTVRLAGRLAEESSRLSGGELPARLADAIAANARWVPTAFVLVLVLKYGTLAFRSWRTRRALA